MTVPSVKISSVSGFQEAELKVSQENTVYLAERLDPAVSILLCGKYMRLAIYLVQVTQTIIYHAGQVR
jgi:hypothetical protein